MKPALGLGRGEPIISNFSQFSPASLRAVVDLAAKGGDGGRCLVMVGPLGRAWQSREAPGCVAKLCRDEEPKVVLGRVTLHPKMSPQHAGMWM